MKEFFEMSGKIATVKQALSWSLPTLVLASAALLLTNCSKDTATPQPTFTSIYNGILRESTCRACHDGAGGTDGRAPLNLNFTSKDIAYSSLSTAVAEGAGGGSACRGLKIVSPGNPTSSYLVGVLFEENQSNNNFGQPGCRPYDHTQDTNLTADEKASITQWIQGGAQNN